MRSKSWLEKLHDSKDLPRIVVLDKQTKSASVETCVIPAPLEVDEVMRKVPEGRLITINDIRAILARKHGTTFGDLTATSIFSNIAALAAVEAAEAGHDDITPYWRTVQENGALREKYPGGAEGQKALLEKEGHTVAQKGRRLVVQDFETKRFRL
ncbi:MAG TPA: MGMT family protein [Methanocella sp.]|nr:MGMT family protein [Methanocella sp.]